MSRIGEVAEVGESIFGYWATLPIGTPWVGPNRPPLTPLLPFYPPESHVSLAGYCTEQGEMREKPVKEAI